MPNVTTLTEKSIDDQIKAIEQGFESSSLSKISKSLGIPKTTIIDGLRLAPRTVSQRERTGQRFTPEESERLARLIRIQHQLSALFTTIEAIAAWLETPDRFLGNRTPLSMLVTDLGAAKVENLAKAMIHGVPV